jgi:hypothetical protein
MHTYKINIGTDRTNYSKVIDAINQKYNRYYSDYHVKTEMGEYNGEKEETIVLTIKTTASVDSIFKVVQYWCGLLNQDCIAVAVWSETLNDILTGTLIYNVGFEGVQQPFNEDYFLT